MKDKFKNSAKWKLFKELTNYTKNGVSAFKLSQALGMKERTVKLYLQEWRKALPLTIKLEHTILDALGNSEAVYSYDPDQLYDGKLLLPEKLYEKILEHHRKKNTEAKKHPRFPAMVSPSQPFVESKDLVQAIPVSDINQIKYVCVQILNPIVAFYFDPVEMAHGVIREQQRLAREILNILQRNEKENEE